jgi:hypothetical protein
MQPPAPVLEDHMGAIAEPADDDDPDVSMFEVKKPAIRRKGPVVKAGTKRARRASDDGKDAPTEPFVPLTSIPFEIELFGGTWSDDCSATDWEGNVQKWAKKLGLLTQAQLDHALGSAHLPIFGVKYNTMPKTKIAKPKIVLGETAWIKIMNDVNEREKEIYQANLHGRKVPKTLLPLTVSKIQTEVSNP